MASLPNEKRAPRSFIRSVLTDVQFWLPFVCLIGGIALLAILDGQ
jgi:hypothetical protein